MDPDGEPAAKRRRLEGHPTHIQASNLHLNSAAVTQPALPEPFASQYLTLVRRKFDVLSGTETLQFTQSDPSSDHGSVDVIVQDVYTGLPCKVVVKPVSKVKTSHAIEIQLESSTDMQILEDLQHLEHITKFKFNSNSVSLPLACVMSTLHRSPEKDSLEFCILWHNSTTIRDRVDAILMNILNHCLPGDFERSTAPEPWNPRQFYDNVYVPEKSDANSSEIRILGLESKLFPFQRRAVRWLLSREGVSINKDGRIAPLDEPEVNLPDGFRATYTEDGTSCVVNNAVGMVSTDPLAVSSFYGNVKGGILAEEMGLGKTLEIISLICLHPKLPTPTVSSELKHSSATLIITPPTILDQWKQEINEHAPSLKVFHYQGVTSYKKHEEEVMAQLLDSDVILTTYNVIAKEIHYVSPKPDRTLRGRPRAEPPKSPLTQISWWRVCLDEAQMVESGVSSAAQVAMRIPRRNAWAVTGTPLRKAHKDLFGLFLFLRYEPWCQSFRIWEHLVDFHRPLLRSALSQIAMRHTKDFVREDLRLPPQSRHTITIPFTPIEEQHYAQLFAELCEDCELDHSGGPLTGDWDPSSPAVIEKMRSWLSRLRQTCLHPEIGQHNRKAFRRTDGVLRTVEQVLDVMIDQVEGSLRGSQRTWLLAVIRMGQMKENAKETEEALNIWQYAFTESSAIVQECHKQYEEEIALRRGLQENHIEPPETEDDDDENQQFTAIKVRLRSALEIKHICIFFIANAYFQLKSVETPDTEKYIDLEKRETEAYEEAKSIRSELLSEVLRNANKLISNVGIRATDERTQIPDMKAPDEYSGIESRKVFERLETFCEAMNVQAVQFRGLQTTMLGFLRQALLDQDEGVELQGDEYENSTKQQDEMYAYMEALRALFADRGESISGQANNLIRVEMKQFLRSAKEGEGPAPDLMIKLLAERQEKRVQWEKIGSLRGIIGEIRALITSLEWQAGLGSTRASHELTIISPVLQTAVDLSSAQTKSLNSLEQLVNQFRDTMNGRLEFYRALQKISDMVAPFDEKSVGKPLNKKQYQDFEREEMASKNKVESLSTRLRYLIHLKADSQSSAPRICTICQCDFEIGTLTVCGHQFCKDCILLWLNAHRNCPVCKRSLNSNNFYDITYKPAEVAVQAESPTASSSAPGASTERPLDQSIYSDISASMLNQIKSIDIQGPSFGSKVDFLCRHLLWLRRHDPGSKAIIFSQYREFLDFLGRAFRDYKISFSSIHDKNGIEKFKSDPATGCFLLHAKAHSTGLNLVVANHVFLCEPLINTAIELQAIARVHRIGQYRPTTVWMYLIADTVEESIYDISVTKRMAHMRSNRNTNTSEAAISTSSSTGNATPIAASAQQEAAIDIANSLELQAADLSRLFTTGKTGGEMVENGDLWPCLFGRVKKREAVMAGVSSLAGQQGNSAAEQETNRFLRAEAADARMHS
jgi:E3 ubiquitin-protein ligase SHPRH